ncbi:MAG: hypothetical protein AB1515_04425 [Nitrospirota bacterium]
MNKLKPYAWIIAGGSLLSIGPFLVEEVHIGDHVVNRARVMASGASYLLGALGAALLAAVALSLRGSRSGVLLKFWGASYSLIMVPFSYIQLGVRSLMLVMVAAAFAALWYHWSGVAIDRAQQPGHSADHPG